MKEHSSCYNYTKSIREGFSCYKFYGIEEEIDGIDCILFAIEGELDFFCNGERMKLPAGNMICFNRGSTCKIHSRSAGCIVMAQFDTAVQGCEKASFTQLYDTVSHSEKGIATLEIRARLDLFLQLLILYLEDGANCVHFHETKLKELFWIIRFYYTKAEQTRFFLPILGYNHDFKKKVLENYRTARTVKELARLCDCSLSSFKRKFYDEFKEPASEWLQKQINNMIRYKLADENIPIGTIAAELCFSSLPQFCRYCKRNFGYTPRECRKHLKTNGETFGKSLARNSSERKG